MKWQIVSYLGALFIRGLYSTLRVKHIHSENLTNQPRYVIAFWHAHLLLMLHSRFRKPIAVMTSRSKDGEYIARVFERYGVDCSRGSSSRGGTAALRGLLRLAKSGRNLVFTPDGPKGPARVAKDGVVYAAQLTGMPIVPIAFAAKKKSYWPRGTAWSCRGRSPERSTSTASRSRCRVMRTSMSFASA